jgi:hypothetical protein
MTRVELAVKMSDYLADCYAARGYLDPRYHPTEAGALKCIPHRNEREIAQIKWGFERMRKSGKF